MFNDLRIVININKIMRIIFIEYYLDVYIFCEILY